MTILMGHATVQRDDADAIGMILGALGETGICAWLENQRLPRGMEIHDNCTTDGLDAVIAEWPEGRLFNASADIRWEHGGDSLHLVVIADDTLPEPITGVLPLTALRDKPDTLLLWGSRSDEHGWYEERIPAALNRIYPASWNGPYAALVAQACEWEPDAGDTDQDVGVREVWRYLAFNGAVVDPAALSSLAILED